jgi:hypothetical protein
MKGAYQEMRKPTRSQGERIYAILGHFSYFYMSFDYLIAEKISFPYFYPVIQG